MVVVSKNNAPKIEPNGNFSVIAIIATGAPASFNAVETAPGLFNSYEIPVPPITVNQKVVTIGEISATARTNSLIVHPLEIRLVNKAIIGQYATNHAKKNVVQALSHASSPRKVFSEKNLLTYNPSDSNQ